MSKFLPTDKFKWIDPKEFDMNRVVFSKLILNILMN